MKESEIKRTDMGIHKKVVLEWIFAYLVFTGILPELGLQVNLCTRYTPTQRQ